MTKQIICMKWGSFYGSEYVNKLYQMVQHFTDGDIRFVCLTDDKSGIHEEVECYDCPNMASADPYGNSGGWRKLVTFRPSNDLFGLEGRWVFFDLDIMITGSIDDLWNYETDKSFVVMVNATQRGKNIGNTSCYRFDVGANTYIHDDIIKDPDNLLYGYPNEQTYISRHIKEIAFFPEKWCLLFKVHCVPSWPLRFFKAPTLPAGTKVVAFPGDPNPPEAAQGIWKVKKWHKKVYKYIRPATWITRIWNTCEHI